MKTLLAFLIFAQSLVGIAQASTLSETEQALVMQIIALENSGQTEAALQAVLNAYDFVHQNLGTGTIVASIKTHMTKVIDEKVISSHSTNWSQRTSVAQKAKASLFGIFQASYEMMESSTRSESQYWDVTKMIVRNPKEEAQFPSRVQSEFNQLSRTVQKHIIDRGASILLTRALAAKAFELVYELAKKGRTIPVEFVDGILSKNMDIHFLGTQSVLFCVKTNYAATASGFSQSRSYNFQEKGSASLLNIFSSSSSQSKNRSYTYSESTRTFAHSVTECGPESVKVTAQRPGDTLLAVNMKFLDLNMIEWAKRAVQSNAFLNLTSCDNEPAGFGVPGLAPAGSVCKR